MLGMLGKAGKVGEIDFLGKMSSWGNPCSGKRASLLASFSRACVEKRYLEFIF
jgi:hypothetical protein